MPVYIRKNVSYTPPSISNISDEDDDDYLQDPDQLRDVLPQPYRMINKVLDKIFADAWDIIQAKENRRLAEERKIKPPKYEGVKIQPHSHATALAESEDGKYVFVGLSNGLAAMDAQTQGAVGRWEEEGAEIVTVVCHSMSATQSHYLLTTIDDMAVARLFLFACDHLFFVKTMNETEGGSKTLVHKCEASFEGDYVGVVLENTNSKDVWFEAHKIPREAWVKELETIEAAVQKQKELKEESPRPNSLTHTQHGSHLDKHKFTGITLVLKSRPPGPYTANQSSSTFSACQKVDKGDALGIGHAHIMSVTHLESRDSNFQHMHAGLIKYLENDEKKKEEDIMMATFHFINPGRTLPTGLDVIGQTDHPTGVALWWKGSCHLLQFSLIKVTKDIEYRPDVVWPFSSNISASAISRCTSHIAIGLENGNVVIWDRYIGLQRGVVNMNKSSVVQLLRFLSPSLYPPAPMDYPPYPQCSGTFLLVQYRDSSQFVCDVGRNVQDQPVRISDIPESDDEVQILLDSVPALPELSLVVQKNGKLYLKDVQTGVLVCQLALPETHQLSSPWEPILSFGGRGQLLYVKGDGVQTDEGEESSTTYRSSMYVFTLRSYRTLDRYWNQTRNTSKLLVHPTIDQRLDALMKERIAQQALRKSRLQMRWGMLRADLSVIQNAREVVTQSASRQFVL